MIFVGSGSDFSRWFRILQRYVLAFETKILPFYFRRASLFGCIDQFVSVVLFQNHFGSGAGRTQNNFLRIWLRIHNTAFRAPAPHQNNANLRQQSSALLSLNAPTHCERLEPTRLHFEPLKVP
jgi:hypothetical protein